MRSLALAALVATTGCADVLGIDEWPDEGAGGSSSSATTSGGGGAGGKDHGACATSMHLTFDSGLGLELAPTTAGGAQFDASAGQLTVTVPGQASNPGAYAFFYTPQRLDLSGCDVAVDVSVSGPSASAFALLRTTQDAGVGDDDLVEAAYQQGTVVALETIDMKTQSASSAGQGVANLRLRMRFSDRVRLAFHPVGGPDWIALADWPLPSWSTQAAVVLIAGRTSDIDAATFSFDNLYVAANVE